MPHAKHRAVESSIERAQEDDERDHHLDVAKTMLPYRGMHDRALAAYLEEMQERAEIEQLRRSVRQHGKLTATELY